MHLREGKTEDRGLHSNGVVRITPCLLIVLLSLLFLILLVGVFLVFTPPTVPDSVRLL